MRNIFKITLKFLTRPVLPHITVPGTAVCIMQLLAKFHVVCFFWSLVCDIYKTFPSSPEDFGESYFLFTDVVKKIKQKKPVVTVDFIPGELDGGGAGGALPAGCGGPRVRLDGRRSLSPTPRRNHRGENLEFKYLKRLCQEMNNFFFDGL